jgi:hypothetical protein
LSNFILRKLGAIPTRFRRCNDWQMLLAEKATTGSNLGRYNKRLKSKSEDLY